MNYTKDRVIAGIVTYNPDIERLKNNINAIVGQVNEIIIVDNGSFNVADICNLLTDKINIIRWKKNKGIAAALKAIMDYSIKRGYQWALSIDQDSVVQNGLIDAYLECANSREYVNTGLFTCLIKDRNFEDKKHEYQNDKVVKVDACITSAAFCNVDKYKSIAGYDESFFIDCVDFDICYQLRDAGYDICRINYTGLLHEVGHGENRRFLFWKIVVYHHHAKRVFTISRNMILLWKKHPKIFGLHRLIKKELALFARIVLYEDEKRAKLCAFIKGIQSGKRKKCS